jgi:small subunit ribosomal protein S16
MVKIRLRRMGAKKQPTYRFVVADSRSPRDGKFIEILGHYNPRTEPKTLEVDEIKAREWLSKGAQPSLTVQRLFAEKGIMAAPPHRATKRQPRKGSA